jgi:hypothetical protein
MRQALCVVLVALLVSPPLDVLSAPSQGTIQGVVTMQGRPLQGVAVAFIELESGNVVRATSGSNGGFEAKAAPGQYAVTTESQAGLAIGKAPVRVSVVPGKLANAEIELVAVAAAMLQEPTTPIAQPPVQPPPVEPQVPPPGEAPPVTFAQTTGTGATIQFEPVTCFVAGEFPLLDAAIEPLPNVARARTYFKAAGGESFYYVEMTQDAGRFYGKLPRPKIEASPITYYLQSTTTEFEESQTTEIEAIIVEKKEDCGDRKIAVFGPPGEVTVFSASSGAAIAPIGFAAGGAAIAAGTVAAIVAGAAAAGVVSGVVVNPQPTTVPSTITLAPITIVPITLPTPIPVTTFR